MKAIFFCYHEDTSAFNMFLDQVLIFSLAGWCFLVFLDWSYWKAAPYSVHTEIAHAIVFTILFLRFCEGLNFKKVLGDLTNPHRLIVALLGGINGIFSNITLL